MVAAMPTIGLCKTRPLRLPCRPAFPNGNRSPVASTSQYPVPCGAAAIPTIGLGGGRITEPSCGAAPKGDTCPAEVVSQYPLKPPPLPPAFVIANQFESRPKSAANPSPVTLTDPFV